MTPVLPENAPFTSAQRAWLNGFFAGLLGFEDEPGAGNGKHLEAAPGIPAPSGNGAVAEAEAFPWHDPALPMKERLQLAEGKPLPRVLMSAMAQLDCGACGYLCKTYSEAIATGAEKNLALCSPGGRDTARELKAILARHAAHGGNSNGVQNGNGAGNGNGNGAAAIASHAAAPPAGHDRRNPYAGRLVRVTRLNEAGSTKDTRHVVIDLEGSPIVYEPGDALGVYPENCPELVDWILELLDARADTSVPALNGEETSLRDALRRDRDIHRPADDLIALLRSSARDPAQAAALERIERALDGTDGGGVDPLAGRDIADLLDDFPSARPAPGDFVSALTPLQPRLYSISSSLKAHPDEVHLTVAVVRYWANGRNRKGVASTFLAERLEPGAPLRVFVQPSHGFRLAPPDAPIIMIGPGTGVAPFRAFLEERRSVGARGRNWLFFGDRSRSQDFLYRRELEGFLEDGTLERLDAAFSRDQEEKVYVQHRMLESSREIWRWIEDGASIYVCGDAKRMAPDVDDALKAIAAREEGLSPEAASGRIQELARAKRYLRDVY